MIFPPGLCFRGKLAPAGRFPDQTPLFQHKHERRAETFRDLLPVGPERTWFFLVQLSIFVLYPRPAVLPLFKFYFLDFLFPKGMPGGCIW